ncbi:MAG TPA: TlpA disulfide reductase family protein [Pyrinomonadaceae bacterium]|nr:TlpA disulfide reductase family protein [Pyrinomonadaceae bacterium]
MKFASLALTVFLFALSGYGQSSQRLTFAALDMSGNRVDINALRGKVVVLNLWFVNCPNCVEEIKLLNQLVDDYSSNKDVVFLGVAASSKPALEKFLVKNPFKYKIIPNGQMIILSKFGTPDQSGQINIPFPMHFILDRTGKIVLKEQGIKGVDAVRKELKKQVK